MEFTNEFITEQRKKRVFKHFSDEEVGAYFERLMSMRNEIIGGDLNARFTEDYFASQDHIPIYYKYWLPKDEINRILIMCHGFQCHSDLYFPLADYFYNKKTLICALDLRGHGRTGPVRGDIKNFNIVYSDLRKLIRKLKKKFTAPIYIMGESLGGLIVLNYSLRYPRDIKGIITLAPGIKPKMFNLAKKVLPILKIFIYMLYPLFSTKPVLVLPQDFNNPTYFPSFNDFDRNDFIHTYKISFNLVLQLLNYFKTTSKIINKEFKVPILICQGTGDKMLDFKGAIELYDKMKNLDKKLILYKNANHSLLLDKNSRKIYDDILQWLATH